jgi:dihydrofolate synthase/folylpolyglutamate synthase
MSGLELPYPKFGTGPCLERVAAVAQRLDIDLSALGANGAVIVGSNGKGSTAAMAAAMLQRVAGQVGLFTSPHLLALNERFRLGGADISDDALAHHGARVRAAIADYEARAGACFGVFEYLFLIAADWFAASRAGATIWEAGIGGRLDPVRLLEARRLALTSLDLEHTALLGDTLEAIARDKLDAAPAGAIVFVSESCRPQASAIEAHCAECGARPVFVGADVLGALTPPLAGAFQRENAALALSIARDVAEIPDPEAAAGLAQTRWPGRMEVLSRRPLIVIDVCHTPRAAVLASAAFETMRAGERAILVCGASVDKDAAGLIGALAPGFDAILCTTAAHKGAAPAAVAVHARAANPHAEIILADDVAGARAALAKRAPEAVFVAGGLFLAAEFLAAHLGRDPASLAFV